MAADNDDINGCVNAKYHVIVRIKSFFCFVIEILFSPEKFANFHYDDVDKIVSYK